jgi:hypothetical protein
MGAFFMPWRRPMSFVDAKNLRGEVQTVPEHYLTDFPDQFKPIVPEPVESEPTHKNPPAKAATSKES